MVRETDKNQNADRLLRHLRLLDLREGQLLPSERVLSASLQVSRGTIRRALKVLRVQGYLKAKYRGWLFSPSAFTSFDPLEKLQQTHRQCREDIAAFAHLFEPYLSVESRISLSEAQEFGIPK